MKLWVIRHAKSSWDDAKIPDFDRGLNARGQRDGPRMSAWLQSQTHPPDWIVSSDAARAHATAGFVAAGAKVPDERVIWDHRLYLAEPETILDVLREVPAGVTACAVIGHNPGISQFVNALLGQPVIDELPTFGIAKLDVPAPWTTLRFGSARLDLLFRPKELAD